MRRTLERQELPAGAIVFSRGDGSARRNDDVELNAANKNPWYVLATIFGEQTEDATFQACDKELAWKNRRAWNGWYCGGLSDETRAKRAVVLGVDVDELAPLSKAELTEVTERFRDRIGEDATLPTPTERINFSNLFITRFVDFWKFSFENDFDFSLTHFADNTFFGSACFEGYAYFRSTYFAEDADFSSTLFSGFSYFSSTKFVGFSDFSFAHFAGNSEFSSVYFAEDVDFSSSHFSEDSDFGSIHFAGDSEFGSAYFAGYAEFQSTHFVGEARFSSTQFEEFVDFSSAKFEGATRFDGARFLTSVPQFHAAEMYDDTVFTLPDDFRDNWPPLKGEVIVEGRDEPIKVMEAAEQKRAYNRIRLFMNKSLQIEEEQFFHRMEMRCKMEVEREKLGASRWCNLINMYWWYSVVSDFGHSVRRPIFGLLGLIVLGWPLMIYHLLDSSGDISGKVFFEAGGWSISNSLPFLGFGKLYYGSKFAEEISTFLNFVGGVQTLMGFVLLFFLGLGLRNRFRLR